MRKHTSTILLVCGLFLGSLIFLYPDVSTYWNAQHQTRVVASYDTAIEQTDEHTYDDLWQSAEAYNDQLAHQATQEYISGAPEDTAYQALLDVSGSGVMGYIEIEKVDVKLPIYHGTSESVLAIGAGHLEGSSLITGGEGTHAVITGHRGLATSTLFTHIDQLGEGDIFTVHALDRTLTYAVDQVLIIQPEDVSPLSIAPGKDYCTLVTCTPIGINTERLLVRGTRIEPEQITPAMKVVPQAKLVSTKVVAACMAFPFFILVLLFCLWNPKPSRLDK